MLSDCTEFLTSVSSCETNQSFNIKATKVHLNRNVFQIFVMKLTMLKNSSNQ